MGVEVKQVKVDNWGVYFLQRLKHFFNRTDYCDLTLQFQDNAQLKVHRLVLSACTEYFELLERTCEMYEDCLVMPDDLQADVVVPIVNFMYTGQLEFHLDLLERLHQTSQVMNMPVLTKLLDAHRPQLNQIKRYNKPAETSLLKRNPSHEKYAAAHSPSHTPSKRTYTKAFGISFLSTPTVKEKKKTYQQPIKFETMKVPVPESSPVSSGVGTFSQKCLKDKRPTRYELPEELESGTVFDNSFSNLSYTSEPLMVHPETTKRYSAKTKEPSLFEEASSSNNYMNSSNVERKKIVRKSNIFDYDEIMDDKDNIFKTSSIVKTELAVSNHLFDQIADQNESPKVTIETKDAKQVSNIDHAKIISEVLKKYPHLVKSNKKIKLKILNTPNTLGRPKKQQLAKAQQVIKESAKLGSESNAMLDTEKPKQYTSFSAYNPKDAAKLIEMGAENTKGPWICLICGAPGRAMIFPSYYKFRRHLVEVHNEKPIANMCEYCGLKSYKRNYLLHHLLTRHGVEPPPAYHFPKCNLCDYIALTESFLIKHKAGHSENQNFRCNICDASYNSSKNLLTHIQRTGHKYGGLKVNNLTCLYCLKVFLREASLVSHLKSYHKKTAMSDRIIDCSDEDNADHNNKSPRDIKFEPTNFDSENEEPDNGETQYQIMPDGNLQLIPKKPRTSASATPQKQTILNLNAGFETGPQRTPVKTTPKEKPVRYRTASIHEEILPHIAEHSINMQEEVIMIDGREYIMRDNQLLLSDSQSDTHDDLSTMASIEYSHVNPTVADETAPEQKLVIKKTNNTNEQQIQIVVSNEEEYKALMNSNHSIIFEGNANKTLTVLSTAQNPAVNTPIDLDSTESNNMMILPDNYNLNVSEALPIEGDNNIVVVYSHPVDDQINKQYQFITSQEIGAQYVQSPAVMSQNYDTIKTSTPDIGAHAFDGAQETESWEENVQDTPHVQMTGEAQLQEMTIVEQTEMPAETEIAAADELPEVTLTTIIEPQETVGQEEDTTLHDHDDEVEVQDHIEQAVVESMQIVESTPMDVDDQTEIETHEELIDESENKDPEEAAADETEVESQPIIETEVNENEEVTHDKNPEQASVASSDTEIAPQEHTEIQKENAVNKDSKNDVHVNDEHAQSETESIRIIVDTSTDVPEPEVTKEQIQHLANEWSEDEYDTEEQEQNVEIEDNDEKTAKETDSANHDEVEESVESIQQEMEKQVSDATSKDSESVNSQEITLSFSSENQKAAQKVPKVAPMEKISSLLNDWEDNESQEENNSTNGNKQISPNEAAPNEVKEPNKDDKIKSLVSDWDDEEE